LILKTQDSDVQCNNTHSRLVKTLKNK